jgi:hypothetical protein
MLFYILLLPTSLENLEKRHSMVCDMLMSDKDMSLLSLTHDEESDRIIMFSSEILGWRSCSSQLTRIAVPAEPKSN